MSPILTLFFFSIIQLLRDVKFWLMAAALFLPCALVGLVRALGPDATPDKAWALYHGLIHFVFVLGLVPMACLVQGAGLIGTEVETRTIIYLTTRKLKRRTVLAARFAAALVVLTVACCVALIALHAFVTVNQEWAASSVGMAGTWNLGHTLLVYLGLTAGSVLGYLSIFTLLGIAAAKPLAWGLTYFVMFELILANTPSDVSNYSIARQLRGWVVDAIPELSQFNPQVFVADGDGLWKIAVVSAAALFLSCVLIHSRELVPQKIARD